MSARVFSRIPELIQFFDRLGYSEKFPNLKDKDWILTGLRQLVVTIWSQQFGRRAFGSQKYNMVVLRNIDRIA